MAEQGVRFWSRYSREYLYEPSKKASVASLLILLYIALLLIFGVKPLFLEIQDKQSKIKEREAVKSITVGRLETVGKLRAVYQESEPFINTLNEYIPDTEELPTFLENLSNTAANNAFILTYFSPSLEPQTDSKNPKTTDATIVSIYMEGEINNILNFIKDLEKNKRFIGINSVDIITNRQNPNEPGVVKMELVIFSVKSL